MSQNNPVLEAVDIVTDSKIKSLKFDKTITGNIIDIINQDEGIYRAQYESGSFLVYAEDPNMIYAKGDSIYIKIPEGDYSNKKFIEGKVQRGEDTASVIELSDKLIYSEKIFNSDEIDDDLFKQYLQLYAGKYIKLSASFSGENIEGDYGIKLKDQNDEIFGILDTSQMNGSIFNPNNEIQSTIIKLPENITSLNDELINTNITASNITIQFCELVDFTKTPYYLLINQLDNDPLKLQGRLFQSGKEIEGLKYQWYIEEVEGPFDEEAGLGWKKIENQTSSTLEDAEPPSGQRKYKLIIEYAEGKSIAAEYQVNPTGLIINNETDGYTFYYYDSFGNVINQNDINKYPQLTVKAKTNTTQIYTRTVNNDSKTDYYTFTWFNEEAKKIQISGQVLFHYNANSDISASIADKEYVLTPQISSQYNIKSIQWYLTSGLEDKDTEKVYDDNNKIEQGKVYNPHHSMLKNIWIDSNNCLRYSIKDTYSITNYNNIFRLVVETDVPDTTLYQTQEIFFIQDGQQGTNGSEYCCIIRPVDATGAYINDEDAIYYPSNSIYLKASVFKNSQEIESFTVSWNKGSTESTPKNSVEISSKIEYVTATVNVDQYTLYYHYPIYSADSALELTYLEIPKYVQYAASGYSPQWYNRVIKYNDTSYIDNTISSVDNGLTQIVGGKLKPISNFKSGATTGFIKINSIKCPIMMYVEYQSNSTIKGWDGTDIKTNGVPIINPQIGVGDTSDKFTGLVMSENNGGGLYGYFEGDNTLGITASGQAYFKGIGIREENAVDNEGTLGIFEGKEGSKVIGIQSSGKSIAIESNSAIRLSATSTLNLEVSEGEENQISIGNNSVKVVLGSGTVLSNGINLEGFYNEYVKFVTTTYQNKIVALEQDIQNLQKQIDNLNKSDE